MAFNPTLIHIGFPNSLIKLILSYKLPSFITTLLTLYFTHQLYRRMCNICSSRHEFRLFKSDEKLPQQWIHSSTGLLIRKREWLVSNNSNNLMKSSTTSATEAETKSATANESKTGSSESNNNHNTQVRGIIYILHGYGEHSDRYHPLAKYFNSFGFHVFSHDHIGHGLSQGSRAHVADFQDYVKDSIMCIQDIQAKFVKPIPCFLFAHSMGGLVGIHVMRLLTLESVKSPLLNQCWPFTGVILSSPALKPDPKQDNSFMRCLARCFSGCAPKFGIDKLSASAISRDPIQVKLYEEDPLVYKGKIRSRWGNEVLKSMDLIKLCAGELLFPYLLIQGSDDSIVNPAGGKEFHENSGSKDKEIKIYDGGFHELFNDIIADQVMTDIKKWVETKINSSSSSSTSSSKPTVSTAAANESDAIPTASSPHYPSLAAV